MTTSNDELRAEIASLRRHVTWLSNGVFGLVAVGLGALVMVGVYKERVDTATREIAALTITVQSLQVEVATAQLRRRKELTCKH